jgi:hypothetical protein
MVQWQNKFYESPHFEDGSVWSPVWGSAAALETDGLEAELSVGRGAFDLF